MIQRLGISVLRRLQFASPWRIIRLSKAVGLTPIQAIELFEETRRTKERDDWALHMASMLLVLALVLFASVSGSPDLLRFSVPAGFLLMFILLLMRACHHYYEFLLALQQRRRAFQE